MVLGCASTRSTAPREYLDEQTAATIKVVADPLVFAQAAGGGGRDFLNVYAIDVNRMGNHQQYLAVLQWWPQEPAAKASATPSTLQLDTPGERVSFTAVSASARELGIAQQIDPSAPRDARWYYFPTTKDVLAQVSKAANMRATLVCGDQRTSYELWRDSRAELSALAEALP
jgi:hypothetical protein